MGCEALAILRGKMVHKPFYNRVKVVLLLLPVLEKQADCCRGRRYSRVAGFRSELTPFLCSSSRSSGACLLARRVLQKEMIILMRLYKPSPNLQARPRLAN